ncbi:MAG: hypothetical protein IT372_17145 [Polyangiaceae bacterium]|nr:hypothetical protein [Polyangiaceae bacterium]
MRRAMFTVFDEFVPMGTSSAAPIFTSAEQNSKLAQFDQLAIQVVVDNVGGTPLGGLDLYIEHSADGRNFMPVKAGAASPPASGGGDIVFTAPLSTTATNVKWGAHDGVTPLLGYVRFRIFFSNSTTAAHVRVLVTQRDR